MDMLIAGGPGLDTGQLDALGPSTLPAAVRDHLGHQLQAVYGALIAAQPPQRLLDLIAQLDSARSAQDQESAAAFRHGLIEALPGLRAFAMSVAANEARADDLVQETLLKAWAKQATFMPGTNLKGWLCTILRNHFYSEIRKYKREIEDADGAMALQLQAPAAQEHGSDLHVVMAHIAKLSPQMREALLLVGTQGLTYEAAAEVMGCQTGTAKSRVSRARALLSEMLETPSSRATP
ncbi:RNA polymerase sigma factor [Methylorubrum extorquens]